GLDWPRRVANAAAGCDWQDEVSWHFYPLDEETFPAVAFARKAGEFGRTAPAVYNAANEACVAAFMAERITFPTIVDLVGRVLDEHISAANPDAEFTLKAVLSADAWARERINTILSAKAVS